MDRMISFLDTKSTLNPLLSSFFSKAFGVLITRRSDQVETMGEEVTGLFIFQNCPPLEVTGMFIFDKWRKATFLFFLILFTEKLIDFTLKTNFLPQFSEWSLTKSYALLSNIYLLRGKKYFQKGGKNNEILRTYTPLGPGWFSDLWYL